MQRYCTVDEHEEGPPNVTIMIVVNSSMDGNGPAIVLSGACMHISTE
jgi:hypothetical protein